MTPFVCQLRVCLVPFVYLLFWFLVLTIDLLSDYESCLPLCTFYSLLFGFGLQLVFDYSSACRLDLRISDYLVTKLCLHKQRFLHFPWSGLHLAAQMTRTRIVIPDISYSVGKWTAFYIAPLSKALYNLCLLFTIHTYIHTPMAIGCHARYQPACQEQFRGRCLAQGHFDTPRVGSNRQPSDCQTTALTSWAISPPWLSQSLSALLCKKIFWLDLAKDCDRNVLSERGSRFCRYSLPGMALLD